ncbi:fat-like cadherin-related tumor suppressor homolog [Arctopsyche grandis]|uniref:fat-like cadherin-related tumor suppressor homolog n=1 Tax=Arctopsyche grandis TaxID=121162 RepID=UPI00406D7B4F
MLLGVVAWLLVWPWPVLTSSPGEFRFQHPIYNVTIPENSVGKVYAKQPPGEDTLGLRTSQDGNLDVRYKIINGDKNKFFKAEERQVGDFCFLSIRTRTGNTDVLNRERKDKYTLEVRASASKRDGKNKILMEADTTVIVKILDTNDLSPLFYPTEYSITIPEDAPLHQSIIKVTAEDADFGFNGEIYYSFLEETDQFAIHPSSGVVTITRPLTLNERSYHEIVVLGKDRGALFQTSGTSHAARAMLTIKVKQVNLFSPEIYVHHFTDLVENTRPEIYAIVRVVDKDGGVHGQIKSVDIVNGDPDGHFRIQATERPGEFNIIVHSLLDREKTPQGYNLTLRAVDRGTPTKQSYKSVAVHLTDFNDNAPVFHKEIYEVNVPETAPINTPVIRLKVTDIDFGRNAQVFLEIVGGNEGGEFFVNPTTGMLYTAAILDAETKAFYTLTVSAIDQGNIGTRKQSSAKVKINVLDTNDNDPLFEKSEVTVYLDENEPAGTSVTKVTARDRDSGENAYISYSIANLNPVPFEIDHFSGIVKTTFVLDYESSRREYILRVRASDWGLPYRRQTEMQLTIKIRDVNDNRPQFEKIDCLGHVSRYLPISSEIITLTAIDLDARSIITYNILSGNEDGCFSIDPTTGILTVACDLKEIKSDEREINVTASDGTHFSDSVKVHIHLVHSKKALSTMGRLLSEDKGMFQCKETGVASRLAEVLASAEKNNAQGHEVSQEEFAMMPSRYGENVHSPEFYDFPLEIKVNESVILGTTLTRIKARDRDLGYNGKLIFGISGGDQDSVFRIDPETGDLKVIGYLDREREYQYIINISVYDLGKPQKGVSRLLPITVLDINDNPPKFIKTLGSYKIVESASNGTVVCKLNATDADSGEFSKIKYSLVSDTEDFAVDPSLGIVSVASSLDRERQSVYELKIRARDNGGLYSDALVMIFIDDVNDNAPRFSLAAFNVKVREDVPKGTVVAIVNAIDHDLGSGGQVKYSILDEGELDDFFKIDPLTGTMRTSRLLDFEERQMHQLMVRASDGGSPSLVTDVSVTVEVIDVNENIHPPTFNDFVLEGSVKENQPIGTRVFAVKATDADPPGMDSRITYTIKGGDGMGYFIIDSEGELRTLAILDAETRSHYWLTVCAQDQGVVPLYSCVKVYIEVEDENDCVPLTLESSYTGQVTENSPSGRVVLQLHGEDADRSPSTLSYKIVSGDSGGLFHINSSTGILSTSTRLDRENQSEHWLDVQVSDNGKPQLSSITRVIVHVTDVNDHSPVFLEQYYWIKVPATRRKTELQDKSKDKQADGKKDDSNEETIIWEAYNGDIKGTPLFRVLAYDEDDGINGEIIYSAKVGKGKIIFHINPETGIIYYSGDLDSGNLYELNVRASDNGIPPKITTARIGIEVINLPDDTSNPPQVKTNLQTAKVTESDPVGFLVSQIQAFDDDNDTLWYNIIDGDKDNHFYIGRETGNVLLAKRLLWEKQKSYNLNISVTDGVHIVYITLNVTVINDINEEGPVFSQSVFVVNVSENFAGGSPVLSLRAFGQDNLLYSLYNARSPTSLNVFKIDSITGDVTIREPLDREIMEEHYLTVMVRDQALKSKRSFARVLVRVYDHNDHAPEFNTKIIQGKVFETSPIGTSVIKIQASDKDKGENAIIIYSINSGNLGNIFAIDPYMGDIRLSFELDLNIAFEYMLQVKASNPGPNPLSTVIPVHIMVTMADDAKPRFVKQIFSADIDENEPRGTFVEHIEARSTSTLLFQIVNGNTNDVFDINLSTGVIVTKYPLDFEQYHVYNLTVSATNMVGKSAECLVIIHVIDKNDNAPRFLSNKYEGSILESAPINSLIFHNATTRLVISVDDLDSGINCLKTFEIIEALPKNYFFIDSTTGAIKTTNLLDHETIDTFRFRVRVFDLGKPRLSSETVAEVLIKVLDVNDCPPKFDRQDYNATLLLPTYKNVAIVTVTATDGDKNQKQTLKYDIIDGDRKNIFAIDPITGVIIVLQPDKVKQFHKLHIRVSDGKFSSIAQVYVTVEKSENLNFKFQKSYYEGSVMENSTKIVTVTVVNVLGSILNEHVEFNILNPTDMFTIGLTSGAVQTTGVKFDREIKDNYVLIVEAKTTTKNQFFAHTIINITVMDVNDNCPVFMNLPYFSIVSVDDQKGHVVAKVHAVDMDNYENGEVRYEMKRGHGELFKVCRKSGEISLKQNLEGHNKEYQLMIGAYDGGVTPCYSEATVNVKVVDKSMPIFDKQFYSVIVPENVEVMTSLGVSLYASSPLRRKLIYTIVHGNDQEKFSLDFNTAPDSNNGPCVIFATEELDYETQQMHHLTVRATDSVTGIYAEVAVSIVIEDVNDCSPEFSADSYHISVSEAAAFSTLVIKLEAHDNDTGINQELSFSMNSSADNITSFFHVDPVDGSIYLKRSLDREMNEFHHFNVIVADKGLPSLSATTHIWVTVLDINDNPPHIEQAVYNAAISEHATRGQFVTRIMACDFDLIDQGHLLYSIVGGNDRQAFSINNTNGIINLVNIEKFGNYPLSVLNISVSDGIYTTFTRTKIALHPANKYAPHFNHPVLEVSIAENKPAGTLVVVVVAEDRDFGEYGALTYSIHSNILKEKFFINSQTGELTTLVELDREIEKEYEIPIMVIDGGGKPAFTLVRIKVLDENDNAPIFIYKKYKISIYVNQSLSQPFLNVKALDLDDGANGEIQYSIYANENTIVSDLFGVDAVTGAISLIDDSAPWESQVFPFWVRATDSGIIPLYADIPIEVYVMSPFDEVPIFETNHEKFFILENSPQGTVITSLKMSSQVPVIFSVLPAIFDSSLFTIDDLGQLILSGSIDRETIDSYTIGILAETKSNPPLVGFIEISLNVIDENDNAPVFHTSPIFLNLAENIEQGSTILKSNTIIKI